MADPDIKLKEVGGYFFFRIPLALLAILPSVFFFYQKGPASRSANERERGYDNNYYRKVMFALFERYFTP